MGSSVLLWQQGRRDYQKECKRLERGMSRTDVEKTLGAPSVPDITNNTVVTAYYGPAYSMKDYGIIALGRIRVDYENGLVKEKRCYGP